MPYVPCFDGLEGAPAPCEVPCPTCGTERPFDLWAFVARARSGYALSDDEAAAAGLIRRVRRGFTHTTVSDDGPAAHVGPLDCPQCGAVHDVVVGLEEFQPARWIGGVVR